MSEYSEDPNSGMDADSILQGDRIKKLEEMVENLRNDLRKKEERKRRSKEIKTLPKEETMHSNISASEYAEMASGRNRQRIEALEAELERRAASHPANRVDERLKEPTGIHPRHRFDDVEVDTSRVPKVEDIPPTINAEEVAAELRQQISKPALDRLKATLGWNDLPVGEQARVLAADQVLRDVESGTLQFADLTPEGRAMVVAIERSEAEQAGLKACVPSCWNTEEFDLMTHPLSFDEYQAGAKKTAVYNQDARVLYPALGLTGEVAEVIEKVLEMAKHAGLAANQVKKIIRDDDCECDTSRKHDIAKELGGVLWYLAAVASDLGLSLADIAQENLDVLESRQKRGVIQGDGDNR